MSSQAGAGKKWGVGSFLSQAVAGVEARLDNILAEEDQPNKAGTGPAPSQLPVRPSSPGAFRSTPPLPIIGQDPTPQARLLT